MKPQDPHHPRLPHQEQQTRLQHQQQHQRPQNKNIGIVELIERIKQDIRQKRETDPIFLISNVELEIAFSVEKTLEGGINLNVVQAGADKTTTDTHIVRVTLEPILDQETRRAELMKMKQLDLENLTTEDSEQFLNAFRTSGGE